MRILYNMDCGHGVVGSSLSRHLIASTLFCFGSGLVSQRVLDSSTLTVVMHISIALHVCWTLVPPCCNQHVLTYAHAWVCFRRQLQLQSAKGFDMFDQFD